MSIFFAKFTLILKYAILYVEYLWRTNKMNYKNLIVRVGDTISVPQSLHGLEKKGNAIGEVTGIYAHFITLRQKNGIKFSIRRSDLENFREKGIKVVSLTTQDAVNEISDNILKNI